MVRGKFFKTKIFFAFLTSLLLSSFLPLAPSANAFELTTEVEPTGNKWTFSQVRCINRNTGETQSGNCSFDITNPLYAIYSPNIPIKEGYYYKSTINILNRGTTSLGLLWRPTTYPNYTLMYFHEISQQGFGVSDGQSSATNQQQYQSTFYEVVLRANLTTDYAWIFGNGIQSLVEMPSTYPNTQTTTVILGEIQEYKPKDDTSTILQNEQQENQQQGQQGQTDADNSGQQVEGATQNILSVIADFFGAFLSATTTNCVFNWGMAEYGFGNIDFCSIDIPAVFSVILNIVSILVIVPMVLWLFSSIIKAFKEFQE